MLQEGRVMRHAAVQEFRAMYLVFRGGYNRLSQQALDRRMCRWVLRPKQHFVEHMVLDTLPLNPRHMHNFMSEDFMRRIKALAVKSHPAYLSKHVTFKWALQCSLRWR